MIIFPVTCGYARVSKSDHKTWTALVLERLVYRYRSADPADSPRV